MTSFLIFDTFQYVKRLREAGVPEPAAEVQATALKEVIENHLATKQDIGEVKRDIETLRVELKRDIQTLRIDSKRDIQTLRVESKRDIETLKKDLTIRMGGMFTVFVSVLSILLTFINKIH